MAKIDATVLVYGPNGDELESLKSALEPVIEKYREARSYSEACQKSSNEKFHLIVAGHSSETLPQDLKNFYLYIREDLGLKETPFYHWAPEGTEAITNLKDPALTFIKKGQFKMLLEGLDHINLKSAALSELAQIATDTKKGLPIYLENFAQTILQKIEKVLSKDLIKTSSSIWKDQKPSPQNVQFIVHTRTHLLDGLYCIDLKDLSLSSEESQKLLEESIQNAANKTSQKINTKVIEIPKKIISDKKGLEDELNEGGWKCLDLLDAENQSIIGTSYIKVRPNPNPGKTDFN